MLSEFEIFAEPLEILASNKKLINTINAHSYNVSLVDPLFKKALISSDVLIPDGVGIVLAKKWLTGEKIKKIAGADLFFYEMKRVENIGGKCFFLGSTNETLTKIKKRAKLEYPNVQVENYSPPYKSEFSEEDNFRMIQKVNEFEPDVLFVGMTAPKQEKWAYSNFAELNVGHVCGIGAVFDFYAGSIKRAPKLMIKLGLEWLYRLLKEPKRMWRRYLIGNTIFVIQILKEKYFQKK